MSKQKAGRSRRNVGSVFLDPDKLQFHRRQNGWTISKIGDKSGLTRNTVYTAFQGNGIRPHTAKVIAECFDVPLESLLLSRSNHEEFEALYAPPCHPEWDVIEGSWSRWNESSNGLQFRTCKLKHRFIKDDFGRGKFYDLLGLKPAYRDDFRAHLIRHPQVCRLLAQNPCDSESKRYRGIAINRNTSPIAGGDGWWVVDEWFEGNALTAFLGNRVLSNSELRELVSQLGIGLAAVHAANIVVRELAPGRILTDGSRFVLTELELAKLPGNYPTVSLDWPDDPYRAPEVEGGNVSIQADLYSLGRVFVRAATGNLPGPGDDLNCLAKLKLPKSEFSIIRDCLSLLPKKRPRSAEAIVRAFKNWK